MYPLKAEGQFIASVAMKKLFAYKSKEKAYIGSLESNNRHLLTIPRPQLLTGVTFSKDGIHYADSSVNNIITIRSAITGELYYMLGKPQEDIPSFNEQLNGPYVVCTLSFSPDKKYLLAGSLDGTVHMWKNFPWRYIGSFDEFRNGVDILAWSDDSQWCAISSQNSYGIKLYNVRSNWQSSKFLDQNNCIAISFNPTLPILASCGHDGFICIFDINNGNCIQKIKSSVQRVNESSSFTTALEWSTDGTQLITGNNDGSLCLWAAPSY